MKLLICCLVASLALVRAEIEPGLQPFEQGRKWNSASVTKTQNEKTFDTGSIIGGPSQKFYNPPQYNPSYPQADPRDPIRELPFGQDGSITVRNKALFVTLQFFVDYRLSGRQVLKESGHFGTSASKTITVPNGAEDITVKVQFVGWFGETSDIYNRQFKYPVIRCYSSVDGRQVTEAGC